jgi:hypothetical protein
MPYNWFWIGTAPIFQSISFQFGGKVDAPVVKATVGKATGKILSNP